MVTLHVRKVHFSMKFKTTGTVKITAGGKIYLAKFVSYTNGTGTLVTLGESNLSVFTVWEQGYWSKFCGGLGTLLFRNRHNNCIFPGMRYTTELDR